MKKRVLTILCCLALLICVFGVAAAAVEANTVAIIGEDEFETLQAAVNAVQQGQTNGLIELKKDANENVTVSCDVYVDLAGHNIQSVTVTNGTFYGMDSSTVIEAGGSAQATYGKITAASGTVKAISVDYSGSDHGYLTAQEGASGVSFHAVNLTLTSMNLRASRRALYFTSNFAGDQTVADKVDRYGIALSVKGVPTSQNINECVLSEFRGFQAGVNDSENTSTLLHGIMKEENDTLQNKRNANMPVYGRAYVQLDDGTYIFGEAESRSLKDEVQAIEAGQVNKDVLAMFKTFKSVMKDWDNEVTAQYNKEEDETLKILLIGNSHGLDSTNLLYEVFKSEAPNQKVVIGALYNDGCNMWWHSYNAVLDRGTYEYYKIGDYEGANEDDTWYSVGASDDSGANGVTMRYGLVDEPWDIVILQEMNKNLGIYIPGGNRDLSGYFPQRYAYVAEYVKTYVDEDPMLGFNMVWGNPTDCGYINQAWANDHKQYFPGQDGEFSTRAHYNAIVKNVQTYLEDATNYMGYDYFDFILHPGTAVQYALDVQNIPQNKIYRDYTHASYYTRLMAAYVLYGELMTAYTGSPVTVDSIDIDAIPEKLHTEPKSTYPEQGPDGDYPITPEMKEKILEAVQFTLTNKYLTN